MASTQILKRRVRSVKSTRQITKAMELVAASKLRKAQTRAEDSKAYAELALKIMANIARQSDAKTHPLFKARSATGKVLYIVFGSDRGLAGSLNSNILSSFSRHASTINKSSDVDVIAIGRKPASYFARLKNIQLVASYENLGDEPDPASFGPLINTLLGEGSKAYKTVYIIYTSFVSTLSQKVIVEQLLPIELPNQATQLENKSYEFEPSTQEVLSNVGQLFIDARIVQAHIESTASEHAMRMVAMNNATKSAGDLIDGLTLELNSRRQAAITQEIAEITSGAEALV